LDKGKRLVLLRIRQVQLRGKQIRIRRQHFQITGVPPLQRMRVRRVDRLRPRPDMDAVGTFFEARCARDGLDSRKTIHFSHEANDSAGNPCLKSTARQ
jgi:hypothetical protein